MAHRKSEFIADPGSATVVMMRDFDAPRQLVFEVLTSPEHVKRWYGPHGYGVSHCEIDLRPGGPYRIVNRAPDGSQHGFRGVYREVVRPERLVFTWIYEPLPDQVATVTQVLEEDDGTTTLIDTTVFQSVEDRDGFLAEGANEGAAQSMERIDAILDGLQVARRAELPPEARPERPLGR